MADVKWIKITTDIFDDEKILLLESLPEADSIIVIWFKLLCLAGKMNNNGVFTMSNRIAYTDKMLATIFRRRETTVQLALQTFEQFGMIEVIDGVITIPNWEKHQNIEGMEKIREQTRKRVANHREKQKLISSNVSCNVTVTECNATDKIREDKNRLEEDNILSASDESEPPVPAKKAVKHKYGEYKNVLLTDEELEKLKTEYFDYEERIERLSAYVESTGKKYKSHYATIRNWARNDTKKPVRKEVVPKWMPKTQNNYDFDELEKALAPVMVADDPKLKEEAEALKRELQEKY